MKFQYSQFPVGNGENVSRLMIDLVMKANKHFVITSAAIDSGSDVCLYPKELAADLGIVLNFKNKEEFTGAGGKTFEVYASPMAIEHVIRREGYRPIVWQAENVYFADNQIIALLGMSGFLDRFKVVLNGPVKEFEIFVK